MEGEKEERKVGREKEKKGLKILYYQLIKFKIY